MEGECFTRDLGENDSLHGLEGGIGVLLLDLSGVHFEAAVDSDVTCPFFL